MTTEDIWRRILVAHRWLIVACALVPVAAVALASALTSPQWTATMRVQASIQPPQSTAAADGLSSQVLALATSHAILRGALDAAGSNEPIRALAEDRVTAQRLGESSIVELGVRAGSAEEASAVAAALSRRVVRFMNRESDVRARASLRRLDQQISAAEAQRGLLMGQRPTGPRTRTAQRHQVDEIDARLAQLYDDRASILTGFSAGDHATLVGTDAPVVTPVPSTLVPRGALALLLGLLVGLTAATIAEATRPRFAGMRPLSVALGAPILGRVDRDLAPLAATMTLVAHRRGLECLVLLGVGPADTLAIEAVLGRLPSARVTDDPDRAGEVALPEEPASEPAPVGGQATSLLAHGGETVATVVGTNGRAHAKHSRLTSGPEDHPGVLEVSFAGLATLLACPPATGVVAVSGPHPRHRDVARLQDLMTAIHWPLVGIVETPEEERP